MTRPTRSAILAACVTLVLVGCSSSGPSAPAASGSPGVPGSPTAGPGIDGVELAVSVDVAPLATTPADATRAGEAVNAFGFDLYRRLVAASPSADLVMSPASIELALAMVRAGARGTTATEMDAVMHDLGSDANAAVAAALQQALLDRTATVKDANGDDQEVVLRAVNAAFAQRGYPIEPAYLDAIAARYAAGLRLVDYLANPEGARGVINGWVANQTEDRIKELLAQGSIDDTTRLTLVNAIYLKAAWQTPFEPDVTADAPFTGLDGSATPVPMMHRSGFMPYVAGDGWQAVELPYVGGRLSMLLVLPDDLPAFERGLDGATFAAIPASLGSSDVELALPRFSIDTHANLGELLAALGMPTAFTTGADFSGITTEEPLVVSQVVHQANIDVDEAGTEAAAATAVAMAGAAAPSQMVVLTFDRPFLFALRDTETGAILFLGRVTRPVTGDATASPG